MGTKSRLKRLRREQRRLQERGGATRAFEQTASQNAQRLAGGTDVKVVRGEALGLPKMSARILELIEPMMGEVRASNDYRTLIGLATVAWNYSILSAEDPDLRMEQMLADAETDMPAESRMFVAAMIEAFAIRKAQLFPDDDRIITDWDLSFPNGEPYLQVASSAPIEPGGSQEDTAPSAAGDDAPDPAGAGPT